MTFGFGFGTLIIKAIWNSAYIVRRELVSSVIEDFSKTLDFWGKKPVWNPGTVTHSDLQWFANKC